MVISNPEELTQTQDIPIWPVHCVQNTKGAEIIPEIDSSKFDVIIEKGKDRRTEMFSAFSDCFGRTGNVLSSHDMATLLRDSGIQQVFVAGLAGEYCVFHTALDAKREGFDVLLVEDVVKSVDPGKDGWEAAKKILYAKGVNVVDSDGSEIRRIKIMD